MSRIIRFVFAEDGDNVYDINYDLKRLTEITGEEFEFSTQEDMNNRIRKFEKQTGLIAVTRLVTKYTDQIVFQRDL